MAPWLLHFLFCRLRGTGLLGSGFGAPDTLLVKFGEGSVASPK